MGKQIGTGGLARGKILGRLAFYTWVVKMEPITGLDHHHHDPTHPTSSSTSRHSRKLNFCNILIFLGSYFFGPTFIQTQFFWRSQQTPNFFKTFLGPKIYLGPKNFSPHNFLGSEMFLDPNFFVGSNIILTQNFFQIQNFFSDQMFFFATTFFSGQKLSDKIFLETQRLIKTSSK